MECRTHIYTFLQGTDEVESGRMSCKKTKRDIKEEMDGRKAAAALPRHRKEQQRPNKLKLDVELGTETYFITQVTIVPSTAAAAPIIHKVGRAWSTTGSNSSGVQKPITTRRVMSRSDSFNIKRLANPSVPPLP